MPQGASPFSWKQLAPLLPIYGIILAINGYVFGADDQVEVLPYALFLANPDLYPSDFYVQYISQAIPNERYFFSKFLSLSGAALPLLCALLHLICSLSLLSGWYRIGHLFIRSAVLKWGLLLMIFLPPFYGINLGGNELYYNTFIPSLLAKAIGVWALFYFLKRDYTWSLVFLVWCTFFHPVAGAQLFLLLGGVLGFEKIRGQSRLSWKKISVLFLGFMLSAGAWLVFLKANFDKGSIDSSLLFDILEFRVPHHYFPSYFPLKYFLILIPLFAFGLFYFWKKERRLFTFFTLALMGCGIYTVGVEVLESSTLLTTQWFKSTIWLKALSFVAVLAWLETSFSFLQKNTFLQIGKIGLSLLTLIAITGMLSPFSIFQNKTYHFFWTAKQDPIVDIALQAKAASPIDAVFVIPMQETAFKFHSQRSCYIDYKTVVHRKDALPVWYQRVQEIYGIGIQNRRKQEALSTLANTHFTSRDTEEWKKISQGKFQFLLTSAQETLDFPLLVENNVYKIYRLN